MLALSLLPLCLPAAAVPAPQSGYQLHPGDVVIADAPNWWTSGGPDAVRIRHLNGTVETLVTSANSSLDFPSDVLLDRDGTILVASYYDQWALQNRIYRIDPLTGALTQLNNQALMEPFHMVRDTVGDLIVTDGHGGLARIDEVGTVSWFSPVSATPRLDFGIALDYDGNFFVSEPPGYLSSTVNDGIIWQVDTNGVRTLLCQDLVNLPEPKGLTLDIDGTILVADGLDYSNFIRHGLVRVDRSGQTTVLEWNGLVTPMDVEVAGGGNHLLADKGDESVLRYHPGGGTSRVVSEFDDGDPLNGLPVDRPYGIAIVPWLWLTTPLTVGIQQGASVTVRTLPQFAGSDLVLAVSRTQAATPVATWWPGDPQTSHVDLPSAVLFRQRIPASGQVVFRGVVPNDPALVGTALHLQAFLPSRRILSNYVALPVR